MAGRTAPTNTANIGAIPGLRLNVLHALPPKTEGQYVVYWMTIARRTRWNFALQRAIGWACELQRPLVIIKIPRLKSMPAAISRRWPHASPRLLAGEPAALTALPIDHSVPAVPTLGGAAAARTRWRRFLSKKLVS